jgi:hypothetical protein
LQAGTDTAESHVSELQQGVDEPQQGGRPTPVIFKLNIDKHFYR